MNNQFYHIKHYAVSFYDGTITWTVEDTKCKFDKVYGHAFCSDHMYMDWRMGTHITNCIKDQEALYEAPSGWAFESPSGWALTDALARSAARRAFYQTKK